eukprot:COSAG01_NODE_4251_length_5207_cov_2.521339_11_plen_96_part_00
MHPLLTPHQCASLAAVWPRNPALPFHLVKLSLSLCVCVCAPIDAQVTFFRVDHRLLDHLKDGILHIEVWAEQSTCVHCFRRRRSVLRQSQAGIEL